MLSIKSNLIKLLMILLSTVFISFGIELLMLTIISVCSFCFNIDVGLKRVPMLVKSEPSFYITFAMIYISVLLINVGYQFNKFVGEKNA